LYIVWYTSREIQLDIYLNGQGYYFRDVMDRDATTWIYIYAQGYCYRDIYKVRDFNARICTSAGIFMVRKTNPEICIVRETTTGL
jgi:hypothetical protein